MLRAEKTYNTSSMVELFTVIRELIFDKTDCGSELFDIDEDIFSLSTTVFAAFLYKSNTNAYQEMQEFDKLNRGLDARLCIKIFYTLNAANGPPTQEQIGSLALKPCHVVLGLAPHLWLCNRP